MALHASDSSGEEDERYATTNVMLGFASEEPTEDIFSHLGGIPTWLDDEAPPASIATCKTCNSVMALILQLNGDLPEYLPNHERKLYVFTCRHKPCRRKPGAIRAIRGTKTSASATKAASHQDQTPIQTNSLKSPPPTPKLGDSIFNPKPTGQSNTKTIIASASFKSTTDANPFSSTKTNNSTLYGQHVHSIDSLPSPNADHGSPLPESFAQKVRISSPPSPSSCPRPRSPWPPLGLLPPPYPSYHLEADYEILDPLSPQSAPSSSTQNISSMSSDTKDLPAQDEDDDPANWLSGPAKADKTFLRFAARLAQNPEQVLRAFPSASVSSTSSQRMPHNRIPNCTNCGASRIFEFQLTPHAISELERGEEGLEGMEWGTIVVGSCEKDCVERGVEDGKVGWVEEWTGVSWEESVQGGK
ncbi:hypothetical protein XPA_003816 [Xanthoria parietina]